MLSSGLARNCNTYLVVKWYLKLSLVHFVIGIVLQQHSCLPARSTSERPRCHAVDDCFDPNSSMVCVKPSLDNSTRLLRILLHGRQPVLFLGHPLDLYYSGFISGHSFQSPLYAVKC